MDDELIVIRVLPFSAGAHPAMNSGAFGVLEFSDPDDPRTVYTAEFISRQADELTAP